MSLKVIGSGLGRTGTFSLKLALEQLGFGKCYHMYELFLKPEGLKYFEKAERGEQVNWDELFEGFNSAVDYPVAKYYKQVMKYYPDAKFIHTTRDPESWFKSISSTIFFAVKPSIGRKLKMLFKYPFSSRIREIFPILIFNGKMVDTEFGSDLQNKEAVIKKFTERNDEVLRTIPKERLLVYDVKSGWEPLCKFLNVPVPAVPFPKSNTTDDFLSRVHSL